MALSGALEEGRGCPDSIVRAAVALGQVNARALPDSSRGCHLLLSPKEEGKGLAQPAFLQPLSPEDGFEKKCWTGSRGAFCCFFSFAHSPARPLCPGLGALCPPRHSHCLPLSPKDLPTHLWSELKPYMTGCFAPLGPRSKTLLLFSLPFLPCEVARQFPG